MFMAVHHIKYMTPIISSDLKHLFRPILIDNTISAFGENIVGIINVNAMPYLSMV